MNSKVKAGLAVVAVVAVAAAVFFGYNKLMKPDKGKNPDGGGSASSSQAEKVPAATADETGLNLTWKEADPGGWDYRYALSEVDVTEAGYAGMPNKEYSVEEQVVCDTESLKATVKGMRYDDSLGLLIDLDLEQAEGTELSLVYDWVTVNGCAVECKFCDETGEAAGGFSDHILIPRSELAKYRITSVETVDLVATLTADGLEMTQDHFGFNLSTGDEAKGEIDTSNAVVLYNQDGLTLSCLGWENKGTNANELIFLLDNDRLEKVACSVREEPKVNGTQIPSTFRVEAPAMGIAIAPMYFFINYLDGPIETLVANFMFTNMMTYETYGEESLIYQLDVGEYNPVTPPDKRPNWKPADSSSSSEAQEPSFINPEAAEAPQAYAYMAPEYAGMSVESYPMEEPVTIFDQNGTTLKLTAMAYHADNDFGIGYELVNGSEAVVFFDENWLSIDGLSCSTGSSLTAAPGQTMVGFIRVPYSTLAGYQLTDIAEIRGELQYNPGADDTAAVPFTLTTGAEAKHSSTDAEPFLDNDTLALTCLGWTETEEGERQLVVRCRNKLDQELVVSPCGFAKLDGNTVNLDYQFTCAPQSECVATINLTGVEKPKEVGLAFTLQEGMDFGQVADPTDRMWLVLAE